MDKYFNIAGPCFPDEHYMLPALDRVPDIKSFVERRLYFVLHAPRQSGKTTALMALAEELNSGTRMRAVYFTVETAQRFTDPNQGIPRIAAAMRNSLLADPFFGAWAEALPLGEIAPGVFTPRDSVKPFLSRMAQMSDRPLAVFFDEVDCLSDDTLVTFLRELRDGYVTRRLSPFPASVALVGMRDIRDYRARIRPDSQTLGNASPFNIISKDMSIGNFSRDDIANLYAQHTEATGQVFEPDAIAKAWELTQGQPWLVNAMANHCVETIHGFRYTEPITSADMLDAKEAIVRARGTHVDSLMERLKEPRVRRVVEPVILGSERGAAMNDDDYRYVIDLGILREDGAGGLVPGNPMYAEIILRYLSHDVQEGFKMRYRTPFWLKADGSLDMDSLMAEFQRFWRENSGADREVYGYREATPHLVLTGYLQRVVNGGGRIVREMALGSRRLDLCVEYGGNRYAVELKMKQQFSADSLSQLAGYLDALGLREGWLAVFDDDATRPWEEKIFTRAETVAGKTIHIIGL